MPIFLEALEERGHLDDIEITIGQIGSRKLLNEDDYSSQSWGIFAPNLIIYGFDADCNACEIANQDLLVRQVKHQEIHIPLALSDTQGKAKLYVTKAPMCSSLYPPNEHYLARFVGLSGVMSLESIVEIETTTLDAFCDEQYIENIDFLQIDVQGAELKVLQGAQEIIQRGVLAIQTEVEFVPLYQNQPLFADVDSYLRSQGFFLGHLSQENLSRVTSPINLRACSGQLLWGDAFYFRDLITSSEARLNPNKLLKLACIADILNFADYSLELLEYITLHYGPDSKYNLREAIKAGLSQLPDFKK